MTVNEPDIIQQLQTGTTKFITVLNSEFQELPDQSIVKLKTISFSRLQAGDFIMITQGRQVVARRFVRQSVLNGITRLVVTDASGQEEAIAFTKLIGLIEAVRHQDTSTNPNPSGFLARTAFTLRHRLSRRAA